jgi:hypothetical protein
MAKYIANPAVVDAWKVTRVGEKDSSRGRRLEFLGRGPFYAHGAMLARINVQPGDYLVRTEDGYLYLNPGDVFEKKYRLTSESSPSVEGEKQEQGAVRTHSISERS